MSGLAVIIRWDGRPVKAGEIHRMLGPVPHRGPDGAAVWLDSAQDVGVGMGHALLATTVANRELQPLQSPESSCVVVADVALYNRPDLIDRVGDVRWLDDGPSDAALLLAGYECASDGFLDWLEGDFAFVIWDPGRRRVLAARDHLGVRTLYYCERGESLALASEVRQLTGAGLAPRVPDLHSVAEYLLFDFRSTARSFLRDVKTLPGGHSLATGRRGARPRRYWDPGLRSASASGTALPGRFRELLQAAVQRRLRVDHPVLMHLSNGFDSAAIVSMAAKLHREGAPLSPQMETATWVHSGAFPNRVLCRKGLAAGLPFASCELECRSHPIVPLMTECLEGSDAPLAPIELPVLTLQSKHLRDNGIRALLSGFGGDDVMWDGGLLLDVAARRHYGLLWAETRNPVRFLRAGCPQALKRVWRRWFPHTAPPRVSWVLPELVAAVRGDAGEAPPSGVSHLQEALWRGPVAGARFQRALEHQQTLQALDGVELRFPFLDRRLVEHIWAIPAEARPSRGVSKRMLREAMVGIWPEAYDSRTDDGDPLSPYPEEVLAGSWAELRSIALESLEAAREVIDVRGARGWLAESTQRLPAGFAGRADLWRLASVALWCRFLRVQ